MRRKILLGFLGIFILAIVVGYILARPYLKPQYESKEALEGRYAEFRKAADALESRSKSDIETMLALLEELDSVLKKETERDKAIMGLLYEKGNCPAVNIEDVRKSEVDIKQVLSHDDRLQAIVADGFTPQQDVNYKSDFPNFTFVRKYIYAQLAGAVLEVDQGKPSEAAQRILTMLQLSDGLIDTPYIIYCLVGALTSDQINEIAIFLAPKFSDEDLGRIRDAIAKRPDAAEKLLKAFGVEIVMIADAFSHPEKEFYVEAIPALGWLWPVIKHTGVIKNARWNFLYLATRIYDFQREWYRSGELEIPDLPKEIRREFRHNIAAAVGIPNFGNLLQKARKTTVHKKAVLDAIDAELAMRQAGTRTKLEMPYDDAHKIVIDNEFGCVVKTEKSE